ncbi:regulatory protein RecX [Marinobacter persicus]|uniref:Regulatory protein RecX n=1 Tax=Marinobacter persicus TaxID=930118 RepID=A0A2S6G793_9GAMM|nr:regulatory protein RecX [Marinobacter persicus]PPK51702.1 regulatory protein [Marinobacter persicus]PPK54922.1 regulatory protein [Marinobacter persicus]PPK58640.1 regulatory protein [Marinobacter persicus]
MKDEKQQDPETRARSVALRLLARREHSRQELFLKLRQRKIEPDVIDTVLDEYEAEGWLDDQRFADVFTRQRMDMGYGPVRILAELQQRGVHQSPECLNEVSEEYWCELAARLRERRFGLAPVNDDLAEKLRQARFLARRGFSSSQVEKALGVRDLDELSF